MNYTVHGILQARTLEWVAFPFFRGLSQPGIEPRSLTFQEDSLPGEPQGKPKNTGVGSLSLLQRICLIQERVLYLLSYQENLFLVYFTTTLKETPSAFIWVQFSL